MKITPLLPLLFMGAALTGCATSGSGPVDVTRFHRADQAAFAPGSYTIDAASPYAPQGLEGAVWTQAVARELDRLGFARENGSRATYSVKVTQSRGMIDPAMGGRRSPVSVGVGGSTGSYGSGVGLGIGIDLSGPPKPRIGNDLSVQILRNSDKAVMWEGRASTTVKQGTPAAEPSAVAAKMAEALFKGFPGESGKSIRVP